MRGFCIDRRFCVVSGIGKGMGGGRGDGKAGVVDEYEHRFLVSSSRSTVDWFQRC